MQTNKRVANEKVLDLLGFNIILEKVSGFLRSKGSYKYLKNISISSNLEDFHSHKKFIEPILLYYKQGYSLPLDTWSDLEDVFERVFHQRDILEESALLSIKNFIQVAQKIKIFLGESREKLGKDLYLWSLHLPDLRDLSLYISNYVDDSAELKESSIPEIVFIRKSLYLLRKDLKKISHDLISQNTSFWQKEEILEREGRVVLPLKSHFKGKVSGIIHGISQTGSTLFIEPTSLIEKNNESQSLENSYKIIRIKILRQISEQINSQRYPLEHLYSHLQILDTWHARVLYGLSIRGDFPREQGKGMCLYEAFHPLIENCVPFSFEVPVDKTTLIITGPNAGGKTVFLKTIGLLSLMRQAGIPIPILERSYLPIFDKIFVDMGDLQSIENSLSTFSAHMKNMAEIENTVTKNSLILLDELGSSTDPEQGLAISQAFLEIFIKKGIFTIVSTHFSYLKHLAYTQEGAINVSLEIDKKTLEPTYQIRLGVAGESFAFPIAFRQGVSSSLLLRAQEIYKSTQTNTQTLLKKIRKYEEDLFEKNQNLTQNLDWIEQKKEEILKEKQILKEREKQILERELEKETDFLKKARISLERLQQSLKKTEGGSKEWHESQSHLKEWQNFTSSKQESLKRISQDLKKKVNFKEGQEVFLKSTAREGILLRKEKGNRWQVRVGSINLSVQEDEIESKVSATYKKKPIKKYHYSVHHRDKRLAVFSLDVRGFRLEEALKAVDQQIDRSLIEGIQRFSIIHGLGQGVLQKGIWDFLKNSKHVEEFYFSDVNEGGSGKTWVKMLN